MLSLDNVHTYYGKIQALTGVSLNVQEGEIVTLIERMAQASQPCS